MLGLGEAVLIPILVADALSTGGVLRKGVGWGSVACLVPPLVWRVWVLVWRPEWLGWYTEEGGVGGAGVRNGCKCLAFLEWKGGVLC
jgi:hypothetical protein